MKLQDLNQFLTEKLPPPILGLKERISASIDKEKFFKEHIKNFSFIENQSCPFPGHDDGTPSFRAREDGSYKCYGCNLSGSNIVQFWMHKFSSDYETALKQIHEKYLAASIPSDLIKKYQANLKKDKDVQDFLTLTRGWNLDVLNFLGVGLSDGPIKEVTIPVKNEYGIIVALIFYNFAHVDGHPKFHYLAGGENSPKIFGLECIATSKKIYIFEGQPDWLLALSLGYPAITFGSASVWVDSFAKILKGLDIVIVYDSDDAGKKGRDLLAQNLILSANTIKIVNLPLKDFTDFMFSTHFDKSVFNTVVEESEFFKLSELQTPKIESIPESEIVHSTLTKAGLAENYNKKLRVMGLLAGKEPSPLFIPKKLQITCRDTQTPKKCENCTLAASPKFSQIFDIEPYMKDLLKWVVTSSKEHSRIYRETLGVNTRCRVDIKIEQMWNVEKVILNNPVKHGKFNELPERRLGFYFGTGLIPNKHYIFDMYSTQHPQDNSVVHVLLNAEPLDTELDSFKLSPEVLTNLKAFKTFNISETLDKIYEIFSKNVTRIWGRPLLHMALDLPFFSPNEFYFSGEHVKRAALDVIVYGDQRCGKGRIAEGLSNFYKFGEVLSGENTSFMNLVGGIESNDTFRGLKWGRIVANNGGVVIIDEASAIEVGTIARLSRIRSEGIADLDKYGIHAKAFARCSLIWLSNARGDPISKFNFGIEALKELAGQPEDIARFDYAVAVKTNEVDAETINRMVSEVDDIYGSNLHRMLILWVKTRKADQIIFTEEAVNQAYDLAKQLGSEYTSEIPLIQVENIRIKLAKIAAAIAGRVFSSSEDGEQLIVTGIHILKAAQFLREVYDKTPIAYKAYSKMVLLNSELDEAQLDEIFIPVRKQGIFKDFLQTLLTTKDISIFDIQDITGLNLYDARAIMGSLTREGALGKDNRFYRKSSKFIEYIKKKLASDDPGTFI